MSGSSSTKSVRGRSTEATSKRPERTLVAHSLAHGLFAKSRRLAPPADLPTPKFNFDKVLEIQVPLHPAEVRIAIEKHARRCAVVVPGKEVRVSEQDA